MDKSIVQMISDDNEISRADKIFSKLNPEYIDNLIQSKNKVLRSRIEEEKAEEIEKILTPLENTIIDYLIKFPNCEYIPVYSIEKTNNLRIKDRNDIMVDIVCDNLKNMGFEIKLTVNNNNYYVNIKNMNFVEDDKNDVDDMEDVDDMDNQNDDCCEIDDCYEIIEEIINEIKEEEDEEEENKNIKEYKYNEEIMDYDIFVDYIIPRFVGLIFITGFLRVLRD